MTLRRHNRPGKFEGELLINRIPYERILNGFSDDSIEVGDGASYTLVVGGFESVPVEDDDGEMTPLSDEEQEHLATHEAAIVHEASVGFITVEWYETEALAIDAMDKIRSDIEGDEPEEGEIDPEDA